jgi:dTMP kinase
MATLFALDRAGAIDQIAALRNEHDVVLLDRYVASNAAYSAARLHQNATGEAVSWVGELEYGRFGLPRPDRQILLDASVELAAARAKQRAEQDADRARDVYERDDGLQRRTGAVYAELGAANWGGPWSIVAPDVDPAALAASFVP